MSQKVTAMFFSQMVSSNGSLYLIFQKVFGLGFYRTSKLISRLGLPVFNLNKRLRDLPLPYRRKIFELLQKEEEMIGDELKKEVTERLELLNGIKNLRTFNFLNGLPLRGQRTKTNARTAKRRVGRVRRSKVSKPRK
jgi:small subunit ribosomal protein S13